MRRASVRALGRRGQTRHTAVHSGIEDYSTQDQQESLQARSFKKIARPSRLILVRYAGIFVLHSSIDEFRQFTEQSTYLFSVTLVWHSACPSYFKRC